MKFTTTLQLGGKTATGFVVPPEVVEALGKGKKPPVRVTINGYTYRNTVAVMGGVYMLGVSAEHRQGAGVKAGDEIEVDLELDTAPRELEIPADLTEALEREPEAKEYFGTLSYSNKRRHVLAIEGAKAAETRQRRIDKSVAMFKEGKN
nr:YdeI/OmpD-associated family protein [Actinomycetota bacterium]